jgi:hypothetical protein
MPDMLVLITLLAAHAFADYAGQGDFMAKAKNRMAPIPGVPWWQPMAAHATIHGGLVALITGIWWLAPLEAVAHFLTDDAKCRGRISYNTDQAIHVGCKVLWWLVAVSLQS